MANSASTASGGSSVLTAPAELVQEYPISTALLLFGVGLGVGILLSNTVCESLLQMAQPKPTMTERLSRQLYDAFSHAVPEAVSKRFAT